MDRGAQVYGTTNIRVMDISIIPLHIAAHTQGKRIPFPSFFEDIALITLCDVTATAYAIGELGKRSMFIYSKTLFFWRPGWADGLLDFKAQIS